MFQNRLFFRMAHVSEQYTQAENTQCFSWGPPGGKNFAHPPTDRRPRILTRTCPPNWFLSPKISKMLPHFSLNFDYFLAQDCIRKVYFMLLTPKFALILLQGVFWPQQKLFQVYLHMTPSPTWGPPPPSDSVPDMSPPIWLCPQHGPKIIPKSKSLPPKNFGKKPWYASCSKVFPVPNICSYFEKMLKV